VTGPEDRCSGRCSLVTAVMAVRVTPWKHVETIVRVVVAALRPLWQVRCSGNTTAAADDRGKKWV
ncbi:hypothetical protein HAX54_027536, partial [Datura stramonium]|nr:hypothetical protein [Datura stramonium]